MVSVTELWSILPSLSNPVVLAVLSIFSATNPSGWTNFPTVDLGYTIQEASSINVCISSYLIIVWRENFQIITVLTCQTKYTGGYLNFTDIRYAEAPVGEQRFAPPIAAKENRTIQTGGGSDGGSRICIQANPGWLLSALNFLPDYLRKVDPDFGTSTAYSVPSPSSVLSTTARETEDCLFLDVLVPQKVFDRRNERDRPGAPVLVWIHGGGYTAGHKAGTGNPAGLIERSREGDSDGIIFVAINYRVCKVLWITPLSRRGQEDFSPRTSS